MNTRSISFRLVTWHASLLAAIFVLLCALLYLNLRHFLENDLREAQARRAHQIANTMLAHVDRTGEVYVANMTQEWYAPEINDRFIRITRADGTVIYASGFPKDGSFDPAQVPSMALPAGSEISKKFKLAGGKTLLVVGLNYQPPVGPAYSVSFGELLDPVETMLNHLFLQLVWGLPLAIIVVTAGGWWLVRRSLKTVAEITRAAESITQHNLSDRLPVAQTGDELERLSVALNRMIVRLDDAFQNSRRFVADASHELRTPLTILHGELENLSEDAQLSAELRERAANLLEAVAHLTKIVNHLFTLSRLDAGEGQTQWSRFDLAELARTTAEQMSLLAEDKGISILCNAKQPVFVEGDRVRLKQVIVNLLDNAIKYTPGKGAIHLSVSHVNGHAILEVEDNGIGIPPTALPHIFERFYRVDQTRSAESESAGLGLSIVKAICAAHGAEVEAVSVPSSGSRFRVKLPRPKN
jgi:heavy metal sensor kinase